MSGYETLLILFGWAVAGGSPGPATLAISGTAMSHGRRAGVVIAAGIVAGSASWGIAAGLGMSALMLANAWIFEVVRYVGAGYLLFLAVKSLRRALQGSSVGAATDIATGRLFSKGMALHLTNPKAIFSWGAIYAIALPANAGQTEVWSMFALLLATSMLVFFGYGVLFSIPAVRNAYGRAQRGFDGVFALLFGAASLKLLTTRLTT